MIEIDKYENWKNWKNIRMKLKIEKYWKNWTKLKWTKLKIGRN